MWMDNVARSIHLEDDGVRGGVLAEEMGLGKTVELLMLCLAHKKPKEVKEEIAIVKKEEQEEEKENDGTKVATRQQEVIVNRDDMEFTTRLEEEKQEEEEEENEEVQVRCVCGAMEDDPDYQGLWVSCEVCHKWSHAYCVGIKQNCKEAPDFICPHCHAAKAGEKIPGVSKTTLIVVPSTILQQWRDEVLKHVRKNDDNNDGNDDNKFDILVYEGQPQTASLGQKAVHAKNVVTSHKLAECDIVITTYDVLRAEINLDFVTNPDVNDGALRARRNATRRYPHIPPPLTKLTWWRVIMDEAPNGRRRRLRRRRR